MIAVQPIIARAGSAELHWDICALDAPGVVGVSVLIGGALPAIADETERTTVAATRRNPYRIKIPTGQGENRQSRKRWIVGIIAVVYGVRKRGRQRVGL